jgi:hypothetical protein
VTNGDGWAATCEIEVPSPCVLASSCKTLGAAGRGKLQITDQSDDTRDKLSWKWSKGEATDFADFGEPTATTSYLLCVFDGSELKGEYAVPASATQWTTGTNTASYRDKGDTGGIPASAPRRRRWQRAGQSPRRKQFPGAGERLAVLSQSPSVTVRLVNSEGVSNSSIVDDQEHRRSPSPRLVGKRGLPFPSPGPLRPPLGYEPPPRAA